MVHFFHPSWLKKAERLSKGVKKFIAYQKDLIPPAKMAEVNEVRAAFDAAIRARDRQALEGKEAAGDKKAVEGLEKKLLKVCEMAVPNYNSSPLKENVEVIIVAVIVALGIRAYFLQPFKIPTASMQPTLNGIIATRLEGNQTSPNVLVQSWQFIWNGRNYVNCVIPKDWGTTQLTGFIQYSKANFFTLTELHFANGKTDTIYAPARQVFRDLCWNERLRDLGRSLASDDTPAGRMITFGEFGLNQDMTTRGQPYLPDVHGGEVFARGFVESGDQLLVDKVSYHFRRPHRDEVFVFSTEGIAGIGKTQHYIKRLTALPGDRLAVEPPNLIINGEKATGPGTARVMSAKNGYHGYTLPTYQPPLQNFVGPGDGTRTAEVVVPDKSYMAMGDNSADSFDSRNWGPVPERNLVGPALLVYWPFANHWGLIR